MEIIKFFDFQIFFKKVRSKFFFIEYEAKITDNLICVKICKRFLVRKKSCLVLNWNVGLFELSFDIDIEYVNQKIVNILHFCSKSLKFFSVEMGLLWLDLMKILWNIG